jgi:EF hand
LTLLCTKIPDPLKGTALMKASRNLTVTTLLLGMACAMSPFAIAQMNTWDTDHDGTLDLAEAKQAAAAKFDSLDVDHDGTLDRKELPVSLVHQKAFKHVDSDHDGTVDKAEYTALVEARFKAADTDQDGTLSAAELSTKAGKSLAKLL